MFSSREELGKLVKSHRELRELSQDQLAQQCDNGVNRSTIAHLEQGLRVPKAATLEVVCKKLLIPEAYWVAFTNADSLKRFRFEEILGELVGFPASLDGHDESDVVIHFSGSVRVALKMAICFVWQN